MAVCKNKRLTKGGKKGAKKKVDVKAPAMFNIRNIGKTLVTRTQGTKIASDGLKGRVFEVSLADLQNDEVAFRKFKLITEDVQGKNCLTNFHGMDLTRDKMCSMVKIWQTVIEAHVDVKTTDGYLLRLFCVGFTEKRNNQIRKTSYAQHQQVRHIRKKMMEIMTREVQTKDLKEVVNKLIPDKGYLSVVFLLVFTSLPAPGPGMLAYRGLTPTGCVGLSCQMPLLCLANRRNR
uniref:Small ribosomal subunit protein eS1 n=1 Tax=Rhinolophus ferrumequinum TaxID=59479 RepID=A0A671DVW3_RHIFE